MTDRSVFRDKYSRQAENFRISFAKEERCAGDPEFKAYCDEHIEWLNNQQAELDAMFAHSDEVGLGSMFENNKGDTWAVVFPDASFPSKFRYQQCRREGWTSHSTFDTFDQVIYEAHSAGFIKPVSSDMLLALADTRQWKEGVEITGVIDQINRGLINYKDGHNKIMQIKEAYVEDAVEGVPGPGVEHNQAGGSQTVNDPWENTVQDEDGMTNAMYSAFAAGGNLEQIPEQAVCDNELLRAYKHALAEKIGDLKTELASYDYLGERLPGTGPGPNLDQAMQDDFDMQIAAGKELLDKVDLQIQNSGDNEDQPTKKDSMRMG